MVEPNLHTYSRRFEPRPLAGVRFANPDIIATFQKEMNSRWERLQEYVHLFSEPSLYVHKSVAAIGMDVWQHVEGGLMATATESGLILPPRPYALIGFCDAFSVNTGLGTGFEHEMEVLVKSGYEDVVKEARRIMQENLPSSITIKQIRHLYADECEDGIRAGIKVAQTPAANFMQN